MTTYLWYLPLGFYGCRVILGFGLGERGKSGLHRVAQGVTPLHRKVRNSGTERRSRALSPRLGTGSLGGAAGVKAAKLCAEQDQIGRRLSAARMKSSGRSLEGPSNGSPRGMAASRHTAVGLCVGNRIRLTGNPIRSFMGLTEKVGPILF